MRGRARHFGLYGGGKVWSDGAGTMARGPCPRIFAVCVLATAGCFTDPGANTGASAGTGTSTGEAGTGTTGTASGASSSSDSSSGEPVPTGSDTGVVPTSEGGTTGLMDGDACDPWMSACPEGSKCAAYASDGSDTWDANKCVPAEDGKPGMGCLAKMSGTSGQDTCEEGAMCWDVDPDALTGTCFALCSGTPEAPNCPIGSTCFSTNKGVVNLCVAQCDPLVEEQCDGVCVLDPLSAQFICLLDASDGTAVNDPCEYINSCPPNSLCEDPARSEACDPMAGGCCLAYCDLKAVKPCGLDMTCEPILGDAPPPPGHANVGVCVLPPP